MEKKAAIIFLIIIGCMVFMYLKFGVKLNDEESTNSNNSNIEEKDLIGEINSINIYTTDYKYDVNIKGYNYVKVTLSQENINNLKKDLSTLDFNNKVNDVVYGMYKLVIDNKTIFFDIETDSALYLEKNITFKFPKEIKRKYFSSVDKCTCCETQDCKINVCECPQIGS